MNPPTDHPARTLATIGLTLWLALGYAVTGVAGLLLGAPSPVFPSAGLALGALLWFGWRAIPGVWLGALVLNLGLNWMGDHWLGDSFNPTMLLVVAVISSGASLQALVGEGLVRRWLQSDWREMAQETDVVRFLLFGGVLAGILSPSFGASALPARSGGTTFSLPGGPGMSAMSSASWFSRHSPCCCSTGEIHSGDSASGTFWCPC